MSGQRIPYPCLAGALVESINVLLSAGELRSTGDDGTAWSIGMFPASGAYDTRLTLAVAIGGSPVRVRLNHGAVEAALGPLIAEPAFATLDDDLKLAVLETALDEALAGLRALLGTEVSLNGLDADPAGSGQRLNPGNTTGDPPLHSLVCEVRLPADVVRCSVLVELLSPLPDSVLAKLAIVAEPRWKGLGGLPVPVTVEFGSASLSAAEIGSLEPGDIVLFDQCHILEGRLRINICDSVFLVGTLDGLNLTVEHSS